DERRLARTLGARAGGLRAARPVAVSRRADSPQRLGSQQRAARVPRGCGAEPRHRATALRDLSAGVRRGPEPAARPARESRAARRSGARAGTRGVAAARVGRALERRLSPPVDSGRWAGSALRCDLSRRRTRRRAAGDRAAVCRADRRASRGRHAQRRQDALAGVPAVAQSYSAALRHSQRSGRAARADLRGELRGARARAPCAGTGLEPPPRGAGGRRAHARRDRDRCARGPARMTGAGPAPEFRCGFAALVGRPNVGKSTLLNALVGEKLSIVTPRPQTTRHRILGVCTLPGAQIAFVDTPGLHEKASRALNRAMNRTATAALADADLAVLVVEALQWTREDELTLKRIVRTARPAIAAANKIDRVRPRARLLPYLAELGARHDFLAIVPLSALKADNVGDLRDTIAAHLPRSPALYTARAERDARQAAPPEPLGQGAAELGRQRPRLEGARSGMSPGRHRIDLASGYLLHHRPWRDTSRILEVLTREHGRFTLFAR